MICGDWVREEWIQRDGYLMVDAGDVDGYRIRCHGVLDVRMR